MKLKRFVLLGAAGLSIAALASCGSDETSYKLKITNASGSAEEILVEKSSDTEDVLNTMKAVAATEASTISEFTSFSIDCTADVKSTVDGGKFNTTIKMGSAVSLTSPELSLNMSTKLDVSNAAAKALDIEPTSGTIKINTYLDSEYIYYDMSAEGETLKYKMDASMMGTAYTELADAAYEAYDSYANRDLTTIFAAAGIDVDDYKNAYSAILANEDKLKTFIEDHDVVVSSVTNDYIYFTMDLNGVDMKNLYNSIGEMTDLNTASLVGENDEMTVTMGFDTEYYYMSYIKMDLSDAPSLVSSSFGASSMSISSYDVEVSFGFNKGEIKTPSNKDSYQYFGYSFNFDFDTDTTDYTFSF